MFFRLFLCYVVGLLTQGIYVTLAAPLPADYLVSNSTTNKGGDIGNNPVETQTTKDSDYEIRPSQQSRELITAENANVLNTGQQVPAGKSSPILTVTENPLTSYPLQGNLPSDNEIRPSQQSIRELITAENANVLNTGQQVPAGMPSPVLTATKNPFTSYALQGNLPPFKQTKADYPGYQGSTFQDANPLYNAVETAFTNQKPMYNSYVPQYDNAKTYDAAPLYGDALTYDAAPLYGDAYPDEYGNLLQKVTDYGVVSYNPGNPEQSFPLEFTPIGKSAPIGQVRTDEILANMFGDYFSDFDDEIAFELPSDLHPNCWIQSMISMRFGFGPSCNVDGTYSSKQCHLKRCWCGDYQGNKKQNEGGLHDDGYNFGLQALTLECSKN